MPVKIKEVKVQQVSKKFNLFDKLPTPQIFEWINKPTFADVDAEPFIVDNVQVDGTEIVEWMLEAAKAMAPLDVMTTSTNRVGGAVVAKSGDPYIPGVSAGVCKALSWMGSKVQERRYGVVTTPVGNFNVPINKAITFTKANVLAWAAILSTQCKQWVLALINWLRPPTAPINNRIPFSIVGGFTVPQFVSVEPPFMTPIVLMRIGITSNKDQTVDVKIRGPLGKYQDIFDQTKVAVPAGENEIIMWTTGFPSVDRFTLHIQPQNGVKTVLDYVKILP